MAFGVSDTLLWKAFTVMKGEIIPSQQGHPWPHLCWWTPFFCRSHLSYPFWTSSSTAGLISSLWYSTLRWYWRILLMVVWSIFLYVYFLYHLYCSLDCITTLLVFLPHNFLIVLSCQLSISQEYQILWNEATPVKWWVLTLVEDLACFSWVQTVLDTVWIPFSCISICKSESLLLS